MNEPEPGKPTPQPVTLIRSGQRAALAALGVSSWLAGAVASFTSASGAGAAALIGAGGVCGILALVGRWPSRMTVAGNEFSWDDVKEAVDTQIAAAETSGETDDVIQELKSLRDRIDALQETGTIPDHPAEIYDRAVEAAIRRLMPTVQIHRAGTRSRQVADFVLVDGSQELFVETKWRRDANRPFRGSTLPDLLHQLPTGAKAIIVVNANEENIASANKVVGDLIAERGRVVPWRDIRDDPRIGEALAAVLLPSMNGLIVDQRCEERCRLVVERRVSVLTERARLAAHNGGFEPIAVDAGEVGLPADFSVVEALDLVRRQVVGHMCLVSHVSQLVQRNSVYLLRISTSGIDDLVAAGAGEPFGDDLGYCLVDRATRQVGVRA